MQNDQQLFTESTVSIGHGAICRLSQLMHNIACSPGEIRLGVKSCFAAGKRSTVIRTAVSACSFSPGESNCVESQAILFALKLGFHGTPDLRMAFMIESNFLMQATSATFFGLPLAKSR